MMFLTHRDVHVVQKLLHVLDLRAHTRIHVNHCIEASILKHIYFLIFVDLIIKQEEKGQQSPTQLLLENVNFKIDMHSQTMYYARFLLYNLD